MRDISRRQAIVTASTLTVGSLLGGRAVWAQARTNLPDGFPAVAYDLVRETVLQSHRDLDTVKKLVEARPHLANATVDWGYGDWETALGAASHMGRRDIAELLLAHGARPDLFCHAMLGHVDAVRAAVVASPGIQSTLGPHDFSLLHHARKGGDAARSVVEYLEEVGGASPKLPERPLALPADAYVGVYDWGSGADARIEIEADGDRLSAKYAAPFGRALVHVGDHRFRPTGSRSVRFVFKVKSKRAVSLEVRDHDVLLVARRSPTS